MNKLLLSFFILPLFCSLFFVSPSPTQAAEKNFTTDYHVTYEATEDGMTHALLQVTLTNSSSQFYASSYKVQLGFDDIQNVRAFDPEGPINPEITKTKDGYEIGVIFNKKSVGKDSKMTFTIAFDTPTIAKKYGKIREINIPGISNPDEFASFVVNVKVPPSFGQPTYIKPKQASNSMTFTKEQLGKSGISIAFGDKQYYAFHLTYHLVNSNVLPTTQEIALPPTTNYQDIFLTNMQPKPDNVIIDADGNWLAQYKMMPFQNVEVTVDGKAQVNLMPREEPLTPDQLAPYLEPQPYWEADSPEIKALAQELRTPQAIYAYVAQTLNYDFDRVRDNKPRLGAVGSLKDQDSAVCREFTDLFIAISRAAGIPARQVEGYAHTENIKQRPLSLVRDILHAWPEYYDSEKKTWVMVDPTWASTTGGIDYFSVLDFDHLTFVIKGLDSSKPVPAGGYKLVSNTSSKDVKVSFAQEFPTEPPTAAVKSLLPGTVVAGLPIKGNMRVENTSSALFPRQMLSLSTTSLLPSDQMYAVAPIPPYGHEDVSIAFQATDFLTNTDATYTMRLADQSSKQDLTVAPFFKTVWGIGGVLIGILTIILLIFAGSRRR